MAAGFRVLSKYVGPVKLCVFDWAGKFTIPSSVNFISLISWDCKSVKLISRIFKKKNS